MNLLHNVAANKYKPTREIKRLFIPGQANSEYTVYAIPLTDLYYNDQNGRINTAYKKYKAEKGALKPEIGDSGYNKIFEQFIVDSNEQAMKDTLQSIKEKAQQEPGVVLPDGRVIDGNRRFTALRKLQEENDIPQYFNAIIIPLDANSKADEKIIKELELDLQLGREERVNYDPIDRIFDVYNTIVVEKLMTEEEYKRASGAGNTRGINRDIRLAELILKFIGIVSPGGNPVDKFYLARDLKLDGPIEEIESTVTKLRAEHEDGEAITEAVLVHLAASKTDENQKDSTRVMRDLKKNVLKNSELLNHFVKMADEKVDVIVDTFAEKPIKSSNDLKVALSKNEDTEKAVKKLKARTDELIYRGEKDSRRRTAVVELENIRDRLEELQPDDFSELTVDENLEAKDILKEITDALFRLKKDLNI